jgi:hypothetical protein
MMPWDLFESIVETLEIMGDMDMAGVLAMMPWDLFESIVETLEIMGDMDMMDALRRGIEDIQSGNLVSIEQVKAELTGQ